MNIIKFSVCCFSFMTCISCFGDIIRQPVANIEPNNTVFRRRTAPTFRPFSPEDERLARNDAGLMEEVNTLISCMVEYCEGNGVAASVHNGVEYWRIVNHDGYQLDIENSRDEYSGRVLVTQNDVEIQFDFRDFLQVRVPDSLVIFNHSAAEPYIINPYQQAELTLAQSGIGMDIDWGSFEIHDWIHEIFRNFNDGIEVTRNANEYTLRGYTASGYQLNITANQHNRSDYGFVSILEGDTEISHINLNDFVDGEHFVRPDLSQYLD